MSHMLNITLNVLIFRNINICNIYLYIIDSCDSVRIPTPTYLSSYPVLLNHAPQPHTSTSHPHICPDICPRARMQCKDAVSLTPYSLTMPHNPKPPHLAPTFAPVRVFSVKMPSLYPILLNHAPQPQTPTSRPHISPPHLPPCAYAV